MIAGSDHTVISKFRSMLLCTGAILHLPYSSPTEFYTCVTHSSNPTNRIHPHSIERLKRSSHAQPPLLSRTEASAHLRTPSPPHSHPLSLSCTHPETLCPRPLLHHAAATIESLSTVICHGSCVFCYPSRRHRDSSPTHAIDPDLPWPWSWSCFLFADHALPCSCFLFAVCMADVENLAD